jgi:hypothetical protein
VELNVEALRLPIPVSYSRRSHFEYRPILSNLLETHFDFSQKWILFKIFHYSFFVWNLPFIVLLSTRGSVFGWGTMPQVGRSPFRIPDEVDFFNLPNISTRTMALGSTQPLTELNTRHILEGKKRPARRADNLAAICEPNVWEASNSRNRKDLSSLYRDTFTVFFTLCYSQHQFCIW